MEDFVDGQGFEAQPNVFDTRRIEQEVRASSSRQPEINLPRGSSATWQALYDHAAQGEFIPVPYHDVKVTDPIKLQQATDAYRGFLAGTVAKADLPDVRAVSAPSVTTRSSIRASRARTST
jgi:hypothetical protein